MVTSSCSMSGGASMPNTDGGNDAPVLSCASSVSEGGMAAAASTGTSSSTSATISGVARFQPPCPPAPPQGIITDEDAAPHERDLEFEEAIPPLPLLPPLLQQAHGDVGTAPKLQDEMAPAEQERQHDREQPGDHHPEDGERSPKGQSPRARVEHGSGFGRGAHGRDEYGCEDPSQSR